jgi:GT2 family glycosyltransferase
MINGISVVISTWRRRELLIKIIANLERQNFSKNLYEIIIVNSFPELNLNLTDKKLVKIFNINSNSNAQKRNCGILKARFKNIIFLDDDCLPEKKFMFKYYRIFRSLDYSSIACGSVIYEEKYKKEQKYLNYRQKKHFIVKNNNFTKERQIKPAQVVTMNMALKKIKKNKIYFNKNFKSYGFEDYEFCYRLINKGFKFFKSNPIIYHVDNRSFEDYLKKFYFLGNKGSKILIEINYKAFQETNYYFLENIFLIKKIIRLPAFVTFCIWFNKYLKHLNKFFSYKLDLFLKINISMSYFLGYLDRVNYKSKLVSWYK